MRRTVTLANGDVVPALGLGTWYLGEDPAYDAEETEALAAGIDAGMTLIDTAEMYGGGLAEELVGRVIAGRPREELYLVSKVLPHHAGEVDMERACKASLQRMGCDYLDLYLYHWRGNIPLDETVGCLNELEEEGLIRAWGVSNFDIDDMEELWTTPGGDACQVNQVLYHLGSRGIEWSLLPWMRQHDVALMAYCPLAQAGSLRSGLFGSPAVHKVAQRHGCDATQVLLAWAIRDGHTIAIPRSGRADHVRMNAAADAVELDASDLALLDGAFPPPTHKEWLDIQ